MPEEICPDVARELLNKLIFLCVRDNDLVLAVRSVKAFRAVNVTFRNAFEDDKTGCKMLARYTRKLIVSKKHRIVGIDNLIKLHERNSWMLEILPKLQIPIPAWEVPLMHLHTALVPLNMQALYTQDSRL